MDRILVPRCFIKPRYLNKNLIPRVSTFQFFFFVALEEKIPITDPRFYSSETLCPDSLIIHIFRAAKQSNEPIPLLLERIAIMRQVGYILCNVSSRPIFLAPSKLFLNFFFRVMEALSKASWTSFNDSTTTKVHLLTLSKWSPKIFLVFKMKSTMKIPKVPVFKS